MNPYVVYDRRAKLPKAACCNAELVHDHADLKATCRRLAPLRCRSIHDILQDLAGHSGASTVSDVHVTWCKTSKCSFLPVFLAACLIASDPSLNQLLVDSVSPTQSLFLTHSLNHSRNHSTTYVCNPVRLTLITHALKQTRSQLLGQLHKLSLTPELTRFTPLTASTHPPQPAHTGASCRPLPLRTAFRFQIHPVC